MESNRPLQRMVTALKNAGQYMKQHPGQTAVLGSFVALDALCATGDFLTHQYGLAVLSIAGGVAPLDGVLGFHGMRWLDRKLNGRLIHPFGGPR